jgi:hypothetical protein
MAWLAEGATTVTPRLNSAFTKIFRTSTPPEGCAFAVGFQRSRAIERSVLRYRHAPNSPIGSGHADANGTFFVHPARRRDCRDLAYVRPGV